MQLRHDGKRRIRLPVIGSVKMAHTLSAGIPTKRISAVETVAGP